MLKQAKTVNKCWYHYFSLTKEVTKDTASNAIRITRTAGSLYHRTLCILCCRLNNVPLHFKYYDK